jgi:mannose/fructose/N-acetylgalactosamine-specific phosphotransferase system component IIC
MVFLLDFLTIAIPLVITIVLFRLYYTIFIKGYLKRMKQAEENGNVEKVAKMKAVAIKRQPKRMKLLLKKYEI